MYVSQELSDKFMILVLSEIRGSLDLKCDFRALERKALSSGYF